MKQKFRINVADIEINVVTEESKQFVDDVVGVIDRRMREINRKSRLCSKTEAALLCALDLCAEKQKYRSIIADLEAENEELTRNAETLSRKLEKREADYTKIKRENDIMRDLLGANAPERKVENDQLAIFTEPEHDVADAKENTAEAVDRESAENSSAVKTKVQAKRVSGQQKPKNNKVGQMFDLLTFSDI
ncbi:MAG: cell division protein ZapA [Clostridia bacterium]|nr:cell division protein ZapA [Clostridia bacterium]MEE1115907.1 cell division protein ZapA [Clostridia bacterium]